MEGDRGPIGVGGDVDAVNEDIYDADPEFRYLALSLTVKNRSGWRAGERLWRTDTFVNTATEAHTQALRNGPDNNA